MRCNCCGHFHRVHAACGATTSTWPSSREFLIPALLRSLFNLFSNLLLQVYDAELLGKDDAAALRNLTKRMGSFECNTADVKYYTTEYDNVGEAVPLQNGENCDHRYLVPSIDRKHCILPGRIDIGRHFILTGGIGGLKERQTDLVARMLSFGRYIFKPSDYPPIEKLFTAGKFQAAAHRVCPSERQVLDPFQFNIIIQLPGQSVPMHIDAPYFHGATRFQYPQWLLAVMVFSNLFADVFIDQVQVVAYFHEWQDAEARGGNFAYVASDSKKPPVEQLASPRAGSAVDGSKVVHAGDVYMPSRRPPQMEKSSDNVLVYRGNDTWVVTSDGRTIAEYSTDDLRLTVVFRARCFANETEKNHFNASDPDPATKLSLDQIFSRLREDLVTKGRLSTKDAGLQPLEFALMLLDEYVKYPLPHRNKAWIPYNFCAIFADSTGFTVLDMALSWMCG